MFRNQLLPWLTAAVLLPLFVLAGLAWHGAAAQRRAVWAEAREESERIAPEAASAIAEKVRTSALKVCVYPDPLVPGVPSASDAVLDGEDVEALLKLRDDPDAGLSPAGLPRRVLAAMRVHELAPDRQDPEKIEQLVTREVPSMLTGMILRKIQRPSEEWQVGESARALLRTHPEVKEGNWIGTPDGFWWLRLQDDELEFLHPSALETFQRQMKVPAWVLLRWEKPDAGGSGELSRAVVPLGDALEVRVFALPEVLEKSVRRQQRWMVAILGVALAVSSLSLFAIHRVVRRERRLSELKSQFVSSVSHELRTPLASIRLMAEALEQGKVGKAADFHRLIAREGARLSHLIENVLDLARIEESRENYRMMDCDLTAVVRDALALMEPLAAEREVALEASLEEISTGIDSEAIEQAVVNLLDNALKFSPAGTKVTVALFREENHWVFRVSDQGSGIERSEQRRIFERFYRLGNELRRETQGTGIGLSLVKYIAGAHGGTVTVESVPNEGATFFLKIPFLLCDS
ncbi:MAG: HAMP domain-containing sensor histidine kinase [Luteolibacter sp.]